MVSFRDYVAPEDHPKVKGLADVDARKWGSQAPTHFIIGPVLKSWLELAKTPFHGITSDGSRKEGLYEVAQEGAPVDAMFEAATALIGVLSKEERTKVARPLDGEEKRRWSNPELLIFDNGLRIEDLEATKKAALMAVLKASLSPKGYKKATDCMQMNDFLGELCHCKGIMNNESYNFVLFGKPSLTDPWAWMLYGHHMCLNVFVQGSQMIISPTFMGAEPNIIDEGEFKGTELFVAEQEHGHKFMTSLSDDLKITAQLYQDMEDPNFPPGRLHDGDGRHLGGAFQDNRVVRYEGICLSQVSEAQQQVALQAIEAFLEYLPEQPLKHKMEHVRKFLHETYFCWIGGYGPEDPFYYRFQSPVVMVEFDHHSAVWLLNEKPAKFHIHTVVRTPNGNDYGEAIAKKPTTTSASDRPSWTHLIRFISKETQKIHLGQLADPSVDAGRDLAAGKEVKAYRIDGSIYSGTTTEELLTVQEILTPISADDAPLVRCIGLNYKDHAAEVKMAIPTVPTLFIKPRTAIAGPGAIPIPKIAQGTTDYEGELAFVLSKDAKNVKASEWRDYILGFTVCNDVSAREEQFKTTQWCFSKGFDGSCTLGPILLTAAEVDPNNLSIKTVHNGTVRQDGSTANFIFNVGEVLEFLSQGTTLEKGSVVITGTPAGVGVSCSPRVILVDGDEITVGIEGIGTLVNQIKYEK